MAIGLFSQVGLYYRRSDISDANLTLSWIEEFRESLDILLAHGRQPISLINHWDGLVDIAVVIVTESLIKDYPIHPPNALKDNTLLNVFPHPMPDAKLPEWLQEAKGYWLFKYNPDNEGYDAFLQDSSSDTEVLYWKVLDEIAHDIMALMGRLRHQKYSGHIVYLGHCTLGLAYERRELQRILGHWGYKILPLERWSQEPSESTLKTMIEQCTVSVHFLESNHKANETAEQLSLINTEYIIASKHSDLQQFVWNKTVGEQEGSGFNKLPTLKKSLATQYFFECSFIKLQSRLKPAIERLGKSTNKPYLFAVSPLHSNVVWKPLETITKAMGWDLYIFNSSMKWSEVKRLLGNAIAIILVDDNAESTWKEYWGSLLCKANAYALEGKLPLQYWLGSPPNSAPYNLMKIDSLNTVTRQLKEHLPYSA